MTTDPPQTWDMGAPPPDETITAVIAGFGEDDDGQPLRFGRTYAEDEWKGYVFGGKCYLSWAELLRRFGPVTEVKRASATPATELSRT